MTFSDAELTDLAMEMLAAVAYTSVPSKLTAVHVVGRIWADRKAATHSMRAISADAERALRDIIGGMAPRTLHPMLARALAYYLLPGASFKLLMKDGIRLDYSLDGGTLKLNRTAAIDLWDAQTALAQL